MEAVSFDLTYITERTPIVVMLGSVEVAAVTRFEKENGNLIRCWLDDGRTISANARGEVYGTEEVLAVSNKEITNTSNVPSSSATTRAEGEKTITVTTTEGIDNLNARETIALNVLCGIVGNVENPLEMNNLSIDSAVKKSFKFAQSFIDNAKALRESLGENTNETSSESSITDDYEESLRKINTNLSKLADISSSLTSIDISMHDNGDMVEAIKNSGS